MALFTASEEKRLKENGVSSQDGVDVHHKPVVKLFTPDGNATWLLSEIHPDDPDLAFGLCDLGLGSPELGYVSLSELAAVRGAFGLPIEKDLHVTFDKTVEEYADAARLTGRIEV